MNRFRFLSAAAMLALWSFAHPASLRAANTLTIISGNGQLANSCTLCVGYVPFFQPMVVRVTDANGAPQPNVTVNWAIVSGFASSILAVGATTTTDATGVTSNIYQFTAGAPFGGPFQQFGQNSINASIADGTVTFTLSEALPDPSTQGTLGIQPLTVTTFPYVQTLLAGETLSGQSGTTGSQKIQMYVGGSRGVPIPNVSLQLVSLSSPSTGPVVSCAENQGGQNMVLTDSTGVATCTPLFGGVAGNGQFYILLGYGGAALADPTIPPFSALTTASMRLSVTAATPGSLKITQGNSQSATAGQTLTTQLQVEVDTAAGAPIAGQQVRWTANPATAVNFSNQATTTDATGRTSVTATFSGSASGAVQVTATVIGTNLTQTFALTAIQPVTITGFTIVSGNNQSAPVSTAFSQPLIVQVTVSSGSPANVSVQFQASGSVSLSATTAATDATGRAQVTATAGTVTGPGSVVASIATATGVGSQTFSLTVLPPAPVITAANFVNGADQQPNSLSPCSLGAIVAGAGAIGVANSSPTFPGQPVTTPARLTINNVGAPILEISNNALGQQVIRFQVPCETAPASSVPATLNVGGGTTNVNLNIQAASPGIFQTLGSDAVARAVVIRPDGSFVTLTNPARRGENVSIFATGLGATSPVVGTSSVPPSSSPATVQGTVIAGMAGGGVPLVSTKLTEDLPGVYLLTFMIPSDVQTGNNVSLSIAVIPQGSPTPVYSAGTRIPVQ